MRVRVCFVCECRLELIRLRRPMSSAFGYHMNRNSDHALKETRVENLRMKFNTKLNPDVSGF
jgi:hypothetical protein